VKEKTFRNQVATLMAGTGVAQVITFLLAPVVTRIFSPDDFTSLEHYAMLLSLLSVFSTFKMELAIVQADHRSKALAIFKWTVRLTCIAGLITFVLVTLTGGTVSQYLENPVLYPFLFLLPFNLVLIGFQQVLTYWYHRNEQYKLSSVSKVIFNGSNEVSKIGLGALGFKPGGLILGNFLARLSAVSFLFFKNKQELYLAEITRTQEKEAAAEFSDFYKFSVWGSFLGKLSTWAHIILFSHFFGLWSIGFFALSRRLVLSPLSIFSQSFSQVFYQRISTIKNPREMNKMFFTFLVRLLSISALIILVVQFIPDSFYGLVLGEKWMELGQFMRILIIWFGLNFTTSCLAFISYRLKKQKAMLVLDAIHFCLVVGSILYGVYGGFTEFETLKLFVTGKVCFFILNIIAMIYFVRSIHKNQTV